MPRNVYDVVSLVGMVQYASKISAICLSGGGKKLFVGTNDGNLMTFDCRADTTNAVRADSFECFQIDSQRLSKDKKPISEMIVIESWQVMLYFFDGSLTVVNLGQSSASAQTIEAKGIRCFCIEESQKILYVSTKKRIHIFSWEGTSFVLQKDLPLSSTPLSLATVPGVPAVVVLGFKREYSLFDVGTRQLTPVLEMEKDQPLHLAIGLPRSSARGPRALVAKEAWGVLVDPESGSQRETLAWSAAPVAARLALPFLIALLPSKIEVHDVATLALVQTLDVSGAACMTGTKLGRRGGETTFVVTERDIHVLKMVPIEAQVETLVQSGAYEEALSLCAICEDKQLLGGIDVQTIHERYAYELFSWGDYESAIAHFLSAETSVAAVVFLFPSLVPADLPTTGLERPPRERAGKARPLSGASLNRAAVALSRFLEERRPEIASWADRLQHQQLAEEQGDTVNSSVPSPKSTGARNMNFGLNGDVERAVQLATLVDTVLVTAGCQCNPPRNESLINLLGNPEGNRCSLEACAPLLAACGLPALELLLWLYRGKGEHSRALALLTEDQCVRSPSSSQGTIGWSQDKFQQWLANYLRALWFSKDPHFPPLVLEHVRPLMESNPALGLTVFTKMGEETETSLGEGARKGGRKTLRRYPKRAGGIGLPPQDVVNFLKSMEISPETAAKVTAESGGSGSDQLLLTSGRALAISYLEHLVEINAASPLLHDELAYLLMEGLLAHQGDSNATSTDDQYRKRLQTFLQTSRSYHPARLLSVMPSHFLHEHALLLSRLGRHEEVLSIYVHQLNDTRLAEEYCARIWEQAQLDKKTVTKKEVQESKVAQDDTDVYISLLKVFLADDGLGESNTRLRALSLLEQHFDRMDTAKALDMLPANMPLLPLQPFLAKVIRHATARKRTQQIVHQLHRVDYLNVKYELIQLQSRMSRVPELALSFAHLGRVVRSLPPQELTEEGAEYVVNCTKHLFESAHVVLQFNITNTLPTHRLHEITVHVEASDPDLYSVKSDRALPALSYQSTGSCYVVLARAPGLGIVPASFSCEMKFQVLRVNPSTGLPEKDNTSGFLEEYPLEDIELTAGDFSMGP